MELLIGAGCVQRVELAYGGVARFAPTGYRFKKAFLEKKIEVWNRGRIGGLPVNIDGGLKCFGHPVGASGLRMTYEIYKQLQGKADLPERQVKNPRLGLSHTFGGPPQISAVAILGNERG